MSVQENKRVVKKLFERINHHQLKVLDELLIADFIWHGNNNQSKADYQVDVEAVIAAFPDANWVIEEILGEEDKIVVRWTFRGTQRNAWAKVPASEKQVTYGGTTIFRVIEGKIAEVWNNENLLSLYRQIGFQITPPQKNRWWRKRDKK
jgi:steroid delta-isomerase-like uncharacterized protein